MCATYAKRYPFCYSLLALRERSIPLLGEHSLAPAGGAGSHLFRRRGVCPLLTYKITCVVSQSKFQRLYNYGYEKTMAIQS